jgi:hypothetical protein
VLLLLKLLPSQVLRLFQLGEVKVGVRLQYGGTHLSDHARSRAGRQTTDEAEELLCCKSELRCCLRRCTQPLHNRSQAGFFCFSQASITAVQAPGSTAEGQDTKHWLDNTAFLSAPVLLPKEQTV